MEYEIEHLRKLVRMYRAHYSSNYKICPNCTEYILDGTICQNCGYDPTTEKIRE